MEKEKIVNVRVPLDLYNQLKNTFPRNFSKELRKHFEIMISNESKHNESYKTCFVIHCKKYKDYNIEEFYVAFGGKNLYIVCPSHRDSILKDAEVIRKDAKELAKSEPDSDDEKNAWSLEYLLSLLETKARQGSLPTFIELHERFPDEWTIWGCNNAVIASDSTQEEMRLQLYTLAREKAEGQN